MIDLQSLTKDDLRDGSGVWYVDEKNGSGLFAPTLYHSGETPPANAIGGRRSVEWKHPPINIPAMLWDQKPRLALVQIRGLMEELRERMKSEEASSEAHTADA